MADRIAGFRFWDLDFDKNGHPVSPNFLAQFRRDVKNDAISDLFIFSHGWNNDKDTARNLYEKFFGEIRKILDQKHVRSEVEIGAAGIFWPSILWPDTTAGDHDGPASLSLASVDLAGEMKKVFQEPLQQLALDRMMDALHQEPWTDDAVDAFVGDLKALLARQPTVPEYHNLETRASMASTLEWRQVLDGLADVEPGADSEGGAAGLGDAFIRLWRGAKSMLRVATYWQMKERAGIVGIRGLAPVLNQLSHDLPTLRVNLIGHSFGARLVSYVLPGLQLDIAPSPVKSLFLIQGAFSHFAFAEALPFDRTRKGDLAGMSNRVDGPLLTTFSAFDKAVGYAYPVASVLANDDAAAADDLMYRWEGMGCDGAQAVDAANQALGDPECAYDLKKGRWLNLDGNDVITKGGLPAGAHSDIIHPHIAWAALRAAGIY